MGELGYQWEKVKFKQLQPFKFSKYILIGESEVDCDPTWNGERMVRRLEEIIDLNTGEKALMAIWNRYNFICSWIVGILTLACPQLLGSPCWSGLDTHGYTGKTICRGEGAEVGRIGTLQVRMVIFPLVSSVYVTL